MKALYDEGLNHQVYMFGYNLTKNMKVSTQQIKRLMDLGKNELSIKYINELEKLCKIANMEIPVGIMEVFKNDFENACVVIAMGMHNGNMEK